MQGRQKIVSDAFDRAKAAKGEIRGKEINNTDFADDKTRQGSFNPPQI